MRQLSLSCEVAKQWERGFAPPATEISSEVISEYSGAKKLANSGKNYEKIKFQRNFQNLHDFLSIQNTEK